MGLLWFRKSKGKDAKQAEVEPPFELPPAPQTRLHLRLRGLLLLNLRPNDGLEQIETAPPLGSREDVITAVRAAVPGIAFDAQGQGKLAANDHSVTIDLGPHPQVHAAVAAAEGDAGIEFLRAVIERQGWRAYAPKAGVFIEPGALDLFALPVDSPGARA
jgi:hypothetical protein